MNLILIPTAKFLLERLGKDFYEARPWISPPSKSISSGRDQLEFNPKFIFGLAFFLFRDKIGKKVLTITDYGCPMKPFLIEIQNF